jgi:pyruvate-formate lyase-activating enzyme
MNLSSDELRAVVVTAAFAAAAPPLKRGAYVHAAQVPWSRIEALRDALDAAGIDWKAQRDERHR